MSHSPKTKITACVVVYRQSVEQVKQAVDRLLNQDALTQVVVVCNDAQSFTNLSSLQAYDKVKLLASNSNSGYCGGIHHAVDASPEADYYLFINPDAQLRTGSLDKMLACAGEDTAVVGAQIALEGEERINAGHNPVHLSGVSFSGRYGQPLEHSAPRQVFSVSGACWLVNAKAWRALDGFVDGFFMYHDDVDFCWRANLMGWKVVYCPEAILEHDYQFDKGGYKWEWMERNRLVMIFCNYQRHSLALLAPLLLFIEIAIWLYALKSGWLKNKIISYQRLWRSRQQIFLHRRKIQSQRVVSDKQIIEQLSADIDTPLLPIPAAFNVLMRAYKKVISRYLY